jgi:succinyl-CoA synthetase alpha subunit
MVRVTEAAAIAASHLVGRGDEKAADAAAVEAMRHGARDFLTKPAHADQILAAFEADPDTKAIVMIGEIGGDAEERAADFIKANVTKPVVGYVAGFTAPEGKTMGHAGAIVSGSAGTAQAKKEALEAVGVKVGKTPSEAARLMREIIATL